MRATKRFADLFGISVFAVLISISFSTRAQTPSPSPSPTPSASATPTLEHELFKNILRDQKAIWTAPLHLGRSDVRWLAPLTLGTTALIFTDQSTGDEMAESNSQNDASRIISYAGSTYGIAAVAMTFYAFGRAKHDQRARETGILATEAAVDSGIVVTALKEITQRTRPTGGRSRSDFFDGGSSFPSGHAISAWSVATVIANEYHDKPPVQIAAYGMASAVSVARFTGHNHYLSDVLIGSAMGFGIGQYVYKTHHVKRFDTGGGPEESRLRRRWPAIVPEYDRHAKEYGLALGWSF